MEKIVRAIKEKACRSLLLLPTLSWTVNSPSCQRTWSNTHGLTGGRLSLPYLCHRMIIFLLRGIFILCPLFSALVYSMSSSFISAFTPVVQNMFLTCHCTLNLVLQLSSSYGKTPIKLVRHTEKSRNLKGSQNSLSFFRLRLDYNPMTPPPSTNRFLAISCINVGVGPGGTTNLLAYFLLPFS
jgi:hypothetical protein